MIANLYVESKSLRVRWSSETKNGINSVLRLVAIVVGLKETDLRNGLHYHMA